MEDYDRMEVTDVMLDHQVSAIDNLQDEFIFAIHFQGDDEDVLANEWGPWPPVGLGVVKKITASDLKLDGMNTLNRALSTSIVEDPLNTLWDPANKLMTFGLADALWIPLLKKEGAYHVDNAETFYQNVYYLRHKLAYWNTIQDFEERYLAMIDFMQKARETWETKSLETYMRSVDHQNFHVKLLRGSNRLSMSYDREGIDGNQTLISMIYQSPKDFGQKCFGLQYPFVVLPIDGEPFISPYPVTGFFTSEECMLKVTSPDVVENELNRGRTLDNIGWTTMCFLPTFLSSKRNRLAEKGWVEQGNEHVNITQVNTVLKKAYAKKHKFRFHVKEHFHNRPMFFPSFNKRKNSMLTVTFSKFQ